MTAGLIGVIVPVYKVEKYIAECIESILAQTYTNFRLILVDDGTPDNAGKICDEYAKKDSRITVIHQENAGVTRARARGVEEAKDCEFITFVDGDDNISKEAMGLLMSQIKNNTDIVISAVKGYDYNIGDKITKNEYLHLLISRSKISPAPWGKLFKRKLFTTNTFSIPRDIVYGEDLLMNIRIAFAAQNISILHKCIYKYRNNSEGCENTFRTTPEYEEAYFLQMMASIPKEWIADYYKDTIRRRVLIIEDAICYKHRIDISWIDSNFNKKLLSDIKVHNYKYPIIKKMLLKVKNPQMRYMIISILKVCNRIKGFI